MENAMIPPQSAPDFLARNGWGGAVISPLAGDASFRRYFRVDLGNQTAVLMDAPPPHEDPRPFIAIAQWLETAGLSAPHIIAQDLTLGLVLIEDFGGDRMREAIDANLDMAPALYCTAVDVLAHLHTQPAMALRPYDMTEYLREVNLFVDWYCPAVGLDFDRAGWDALWRDMLAHVMDSTEPTVTVLRDYHAENIMLLDRPGIGQFGLLDFQDALAGHPAYDLVSMLQDARRDVSPDIEAMARAYYARCVPVSADFDTCYAVLALQRNIKILGIFTRLWKRDGKPHYRSFQPRMWKYVTRSLGHPVAAPLAAWLDTNVPEDMRASAWAEYAA